MKKTIYLIATILIGINTYAQTIAGGAFYGLAICTDSTVMAWGKNEFGQLGNGTFNNSSISPIAVNTLTSIKAVAGATNHSLALKSDGTVWAWGKNDNGQLGIGTSTNSYSPNQIVGLDNIIAIAAGYGHSMALKNDGTVWVWGDGWFDQLGNGMLGSSIPVQLISLTNIIAIAAGNGHSLALKNDGTVWAWGLNQYGQIGNGVSGNGSFINQPTPIQVLSNAKAISAGLDHSIALKNDSTVWCWGRNGFLQLGINGNLNQNLPVQSPYLNSVEKIYTSQNHNIAIKTDGTVWTWGRNNNGQLGNTSSNIVTPVQVLGITNAKAITAGLNYCFVVKADHTVLSWGGNGYGELCDGTTVNHTLPNSTIGLCNILLPSLQTGMKVNENVDEDISIYPNPFSNILTLNNYSTKKINQCLIVNNIGEIIYNSSTPSKTINTQDFKNGLYFVKIIMEDYSISIHKLVRQ